MPTTTYHTYPELVHDGGRLAATEWAHYNYWNPTEVEAVAATINHDPDAIVLRVNKIRGFAPGGIGIV